MKRVVILIGVVLLAGVTGRGAEPALDWPLTRAPGDAVNRGVTFSNDGAAFNGRGAHLELAHAPNLGARDFTLSVWVRAEGAEVSGDLVSQYDQPRRRGFHLSLKSNAVTTSQANRRQLQFGIDDGKVSKWHDRGRPGNAILAFSLVAHEGYLYAGTCEPGVKDAGRVYRSRGDGTWEACGAPDASNTVTAMAVLEGRLYAATGKYRLGGSALPESTNANLGGRLFRFDGVGRWSACGQLPEVEAVGGLAVFRGKLYASSLYKPAGFFRYEGGMSWTSLPVPNGKRVEALAVYRDHLYATSYDGGHVYRYDGSSWTDLGRLGDNTQTYSFAVYGGNLLVGTWPSGRVYRYEAADRWTDLGRLGGELEVMGMLVHNGRLLAGTLPLAEVYGYEGGTTWSRLTQLDTTPDVRYRRAWTAAEYRGEVYFSTLPSGRTFSFAAGQSVAWDSEFPTGWQHVAAVRAGPRLQLFVNGKRVSESAPFDPALYDLTSSQPWRIGIGANESFHGQMRDLRVYTRALNAVEIDRLAQSR